MIMIIDIHIILKGLENTRLAYKSCYYPFDIFKNQFWIVWTQEKEEQIQLTKEQLEIKNQLLLAAAGPNDDVTRQLMAQDDVTRQLMDILKQAGGQEAEQPSESDSEDNTSVRGRDR